MSTTVLDTSTWFPKQYIALKRRRRKGEGGAKMTEEKLVYRNTLQSNFDVL